MHCVKLAAGLLSCIALFLVQTGLLHRALLGRESPFSEVVEKWAEAQWWRVHYQMKEARQCHRGCGRDKGCHKKCPQPWVEFKRECEQRMPIWMCIESCGLDFACRTKCERPESENMQALVNQTRHCHERCMPGDVACHRACPSSCEKLLLNVRCHVACGPGDTACHQACRKHGRHHHGRSQRHGHHLHGHQKQSHRSDGGDTEGVDNEIEHTDRLEGYNLSGLTESDSDPLDGQMLGRGERPADASEPDDEKAGEVEEWEDRDDDEEHEDANEGGRWLNEGRDAEGKEADNSVVANNWEEEEVEEEDEAGNWDEAEEDGELEGEDTGRRVLPLSWLRHLSKLPPGEPHEILV